MILRYECGKLTEQRTHREALRLEGRVSPVISIVGAGGKTTTALHLAQDFVDAQIPAAVTTTTHMQVWEKPCFLLEESMEKFQEILRWHGQVWFGVPAPEKRPDVSGKVNCISKVSGKMRSVSEGFLKAVLNLRIPLVIEADGARRLPLKVPGEHEPVLVPETTDVLSVYGLDAVGKPISEICFRPELAAGLLQKETADCIEAEDIAALAGDTRGGRKNVREHQNYWVILNKADDEYRLKTALQICRLLEQNGICNILVTSEATIQPRTE